MVASTKIRAVPKAVMIAKDVLLVPIYLYQGHKVKRDTVRLSEPKGERHGSVGLNTTNDYLPILKVMIVGDSAAAGVGTLTQQEALAGKLIPALQQHAIITQNYSALNWSLQATTGHTSFDILRRLYVLPVPSTPINVMVLSVGVNDATSNVSTTTWRQQLKDIIAIARRKFGVQHLIFSSLPPMAKMPALPTPLNDFMGAKSDKLDKVLQHVCHEHTDVHYMAADFAHMAKQHGNGAFIDSQVMFASDGFHPSSITYGYWAQQLAELINDILSTEY